MKFFIDFNLMGVKVNNILLDGNYATMDTSNGEYIVRINWLI